MGFIFTRAGSSKLYCKFRDGTDAKGRARYRMASTGFDVGQEDKARACLAEIERLIRERDGGEVAPVAEVAPAGPLTVRRFAEQWLPKREARDLDWKNDRSRLAHHILPVIGELPIGEVRTRHIIELVDRLRTSPKRYAQRTVYNVYSVVSALFRDAKLDGVIEQSPCCLDERQLGRIVDKDPEWRDGALFTREEAQTIISTPKIPPDRQMVYALELLAGVRPGEAAALRWRHYDAAMEPLGKLLVAQAYNTRKHRAKGTKTESTKHVPVHPTLAAMLASWKLHGWAAMMGRAPEPDDLIVPLPPEHAARRRTRKGEAFRGHDYSGKRWREEDLPALGWRFRMNYDMRATFITLALEDGADPLVIESRVTHTKPQRSAFDGYNRGRQWAITCAEVAKLRLVRRELGGEILTLPIAAGAGTIDARGVVVQAGSSPVAPERKSPEMQGGDGGGGGNRTLPEHMR